MSRCAQET